MFKMIKVVFELILAIALIVGIYVGATELYGIFTGVSGQAIRETLFLTAKYHTIGLSMGEEIKYAAYYAYLVA